MNSQPPEPAGLLRLSELFGNGPPQWTIQRGIEHERPCQSLEQANQQRKKAMHKLKWHGNREGEQQALAVRANLLSCKPAAPCLSGACPICMRAQQRLLVVATVNLLPEPFQLFGCKRTALSLVPDFGRVPAGGLAEFDTGAFRRATHGALTSAGVAQFLIGLDISLNHRKGALNEAYWQLQWWGFFEPPAGPWHERLKALVNASGEVTRPVKCITPDSVEAAAAYGLKTTFKRRESYIKRNLTRSDRGPCRNTHVRPLQGSAWIELMVFLDRIGLQRRLLSQGLTRPFRPLVSRPSSTLIG